MNKIATFLISAALLALSSVAPAHAGTRLDPEYTDPAGDVPFLVEPGSNADWADVVSAWMEPIDGGVRVSVETVGDASDPDEDTAFYLSWDVLDGQDEHCYADLNFYVTEGDEWAFNSQTADLNYTCQGEEQPYTVPIADVTISLGSLWDAGPFPVDVDGTVVSVDVPFSAFTSGQNASLYTAGTGLQITSVSTQILLDPLFLLGDQQEMCRPSYTPPFGFESGCPDDAAIYTIE